MLYTSLRERYASRGRHAMFPISAWSDQYSKFCCFMMTSIDTPCENRSFIFARRPALIFSLLALWPWLAHHVSHPLPPRCCTATPSFASELSCCRTRRALPWTAGPGERSVWGTCDPHLARTHDHARQVLQGELQCLASRGHGALQDLSLAAEVPSCALRG